ncbi:hypothetical protein D3C78_684010 [compost metagenome]
MPILHLYTPNAKGLFIDVNDLLPVTQLNVHGVMVSVHRLPEPNVFYRNAAFAFVMLAHDRACFIHNRDRYRGIANCSNLVLNNASRAFNSGNDRYVLHIGARSRIDFYGAMDTRVVEEVKVRTVFGDLAESRNLLLAIVPDRKRRLIQYIVHGNGEPVFSILEVCIYFRFKGCKTAIVLHNQLSIDIDLCLMRR